MNGDDRVLREIKDRIARFESTGDPAAVYEALESVSSIARDASAQDTAARARVTASWLAFLTGIDRVLDHAWTQGAAPVRGTTPPPDSGPVSAAGEVDPANIADLAERARYVDALKASKDYAKHYSTQIQLHRIDETAMQGFGEWIATRYPSSDPERASIEAAIASTTADEGRRSRLRSAVLRSNTR